MQIEEGSARPLVHTFDVKKRAYFGNTSMEAEISLLMANQTMVCKSFSGTSTVQLTRNGM
jgi:tRNA G10  N-methylase Trm11